MRRSRRNYGKCECEAVFDNELREMSGAPEAQLLRSMGRIPDNSYQLEDGSKILQWRWDTSYIDPGMPALYPRYGGWGWGWGGGWWTPMGGFPPTLVRQNCIVEWTMVGACRQGLSLARQRLPEDHAVVRFLGWINEQAEAKRMGRHCRPIYVLQAAGRSALVEEAAQLARRGSGA